MSLQCNGGGRERPSYSGNIKAMTVRYLLSWAGGGAGVSAGYLPLQRDDCQVRVRSGYLDATHVSASSVVLLWGETGRADRLAAAN